MNDVRVVGTRRRPGRCVYCHDSLDAFAHHCGDCGASVHPDCFEENRGRCPTPGCGAPDGARRSSREERRARRERHRRRREAPGDEALERWAEEAWRHTPPGAAARLRPYARLIASGVTHLLVLVGTAALLVWGATSGASEVWEALKRHPYRGGESLWGVLASLFVGGLAFLFAFMSARWLWRWPRVWSEVGYLLDVTRPVPMRLTVQTTGSGRDKRIHAQLHPVGREASPTRFQVAGLLPPRWLREDRTGTPVLVYGIADQDPPFLIENEAGQLALVHPDWP